MCFTTLYYTLHYTDTYLHQIYLFYSIHFATYSGLYISYYTNLCLSISLTLFLLSPPCIPRPPLASLSPVALSGQA